MLSLSAAKKRKRDDQKNQEFPVPGRFPVGFFFDAKEMEHGVDSLTCACTKSRRGVV